MTDTARDIFDTEQTTKSSNKNWNNYKLRLVLDLLNIKNYYDLSVICGMHYNTIRTLISRPPLMNVRLATVARCFEALKTLFEKNSFRIKKSDRSYAKRALKEWALGTLSNRVLLRYDSRRKDRISVKQCRVRRKFEKRRKSEIEALKIMIQKW